MIHKCKFNVDNKCLCRVKQLKVYGNRIPKQVIKNGFDLREEICSKCDERKK